MSYGPGPTSVGTLFTNANNGNTSLWADADQFPGDCNCPSDGPGGGEGGEPGDGSGGGDDTCGNGSKKQYFSYFGSASPAPIDTWNMTNGATAAIYIGHPINPCYNGPVIMNLGLGSDEVCGTITPDPPPGLEENCVAPATRIALFPEGCLAAGEVQAGDLLMTRRADGTLAGEVVSAVRLSTQPRVLLETEDGRQLHCSLSHEVMVADAELPQGRRTVVSELTLSDRLLTQEGTPVALLRIARQPEGPVIRISLAGPEHLYLSEGLWSHNKVSIEWPSGVIP